jgi:hypothetical protein
VLPQHRNYQIADAIGQDILRSDLQNTWTGFVGQGE